MKTIFWSACADQNEEAWTFEGEPGSFPFFHAATPSPRLPPPSAHPIGSGGAPSPHKCYHLDSEGALDRKRTLEESANIRRKKTTNEGMNDQDEVVIYITKIFYKDIISSLQRKLRHNSFRTASPGGAPPFPTRHVEDGRWRETRWKVGDVIDVTLGTKNVPERKTDILKPRSNP